ncbi:MAG: response regulator transcription factor [Steroidobacteraceae bacterium]
MNTQQPSGHRVLVVDDHPIVRQGLRRLINAQDGLVVCGEAATPREARQAVKLLDPHAVIVDLSLSEGDGIGLVRDLQAHHPALPLIVLSMHDESVYAPRLLAMGASAYVAKDAAGDRLIQVLLDILANAGSASRPSDQPEPSTAGPTLQELSGRELQVLQLIGEGYSSKKMAELLHLSIKTVEAHRQRIKRKLALRSNAQLVQFAVTQADRP